MNFEALSESSATNSVSQDQKTPGVSAIKRRIRVGKKYHHVQNNLRKQLINRVEKKGEKIIQVARELNMKYSTAKSILKVYRSEGRTSKIPKSQRYLSLRTIDEDFESLYYEKPAEKKRAKSTKKTKRIAPLSEEGAHSSRGPRTRLQLNKTKLYSELEENLLELDSAEANCNSEEASEPPITKKLHQEVPIKCEVGIAVKSEAGIIVKSEPGIKAEEEEESAGSLLSTSFKAKKEEKYANSSEDEVASAQLPRKSDNKASVETQSGNIRRPEQTKQALDNLRPKPMLPFDLLLPTMYPAQYNQAIMSNLIILRAQQLVLQIHSLKQQQQNILAKRK